MALKLKAEYHAYTNKMYASERVNAKKKRKKKKCENIARFVHVGKSENILILQGYSTYP